MIDPRSMLQGRRIILAHADDFHRSYLSEVLGSSGFRVMGDLKQWRDAEALLHAEPRTDALVLGSTLINPQTVETLTDTLRTWVVLILGGEATGVGPLSTLGRILPAPYAGFQVVHALRELLHLDQVLPLGSSISPHRREH